LRRRACSDVGGAAVAGGWREQRTSGASSIRIVLRGGDCVELVAAREAIASSSIVRVCVRSVDVSWKVCEVCEICDGSSEVIDNDAPSAGPALLGEAGTCRIGIGLRPGIVVGGVGAPRIGNACSFEAGASTENNPDSPSTKANR